MKESLAELLDEYKIQENIVHFENSNGMDNINKICAALGSEESPFKYGSPLEVFLSDNPGAIGALLEWIADQDLPEWKENLESHLLEKESEEDSEE